MSACIVPTSPDFQDPDPLLGNLAPLLEGTPPLGARVTVTPGRQLEFTVRVADPNPGDAVRAKWIFDYPPYNSAWSQLRQEDEGSPAGQEVTFTYRVSCDHFINPAERHRRLFVAITDGQWKAVPPKDGELSFTQVERGFVVTGSWSLELVDCLAEAGLSLGLDGRAP